MTTTTEQREFLREFVRQLALCETEEAKEALHRTAQGLVEKAGW